MELTFQHFVKFEITKNPPIEPKISNALMPTSKAIVQLALDLPRFCLLKSQKYKMAFDLILNKDYYETENLKCEKHKNALIML